MGMKTVVAFWVEMTRQDKISCVSFLFELALGGTTLCGGFPLYTTYIAGDDFLPLW